jgi:NitT/TauT family transport system ATP-binding protein
MPLIRFRDVEKTFRKGRVSYSAVRDFSLDIEEGEFFCLLGPSGCGKTTILDLLAGFERPTLGAIEVDGMVVTGPGNDRAVVFQGDDSLYGWLTASENVEFGLRLRGVSASQRRALAVQYLELVGLRNQDGKRPHELSGGMKQRIQIARILINEPRVLLMDEPFGALDAQTRRVLQNELLNIWNKTGKTVLFITHDIDEAIRLGSRVGIMEAGPGSRLKTVVSIDPGAKQGRTSVDYLKHYELIQGHIEEEVNKALLRETGE